MVVQTVVVLVATLMLVLERLLLMTVLVIAVGMYCGS